ncbi:4a-hydroxytetrahydrobiopterin dehydratase [Azospirillum halopraeferens]|uniref:4a-hydroxytetrahydrobiopterin dehydratase n=1 Tax=Azospirillum halopraeferens TaxID=34010 RepID=UPI0003F53AE1|nr:4a-hydroxytetrahydrobiopterin dehydratase [Azospirillum halopraeferens]
MTAEQDPTGAVCDLAQSKCEPCRGGIPPMDRATADTYLVQVPGWSIAGDPDHLVRTFRFDDFRAAQAFAVRVGNLCEDEGHHAEIIHGWGYCTVKFWTHKIGGLHENDFIMAAKVDGLHGAPYVPASASMGDVSPTARDVG